MRKYLGIIILFQAFSFASPANNKIQEAAYILNIESDTARAVQLLYSALALNASMHEKLSAHLYLAKIAETRQDTLKAIEHYGFLKKNSQSVSLAYMAANKEKLLGAMQEKVKIAGDTINFAQQKNDNRDIPREPRFSNCVLAGELHLAQRIVYNCPADNLLYIVSKKKGAEPRSISYTDLPVKVFIVFDGLFLYCENRLRFYKLGTDLDLAWQISTLEVQDLEDMGDKIFVLDISGKISLLDKNSGTIVSAVKSDGENFFKPGTGLIGTYQKNGGISVFDTLLNNLWDYQMDGEIAEPPIVKSDSVIFNMQKGNSEILYTGHYQRIAAPSGNSPDSLLAFESGNPQAWYSIAEQKNNDSTWMRAVIYGARKPEFSPLVFSKYAEKIGAKWVRYVPFSSKLLYPKMFSDANWLFILDNEAQNLLKFSLESGNAGGEISFLKDKKYILGDNEPPWLILSSGHSLLQFSLREQKSISLEMTGKPYSFLRNRDSIYVGLGNGFVLKYFTPKMQLEKSHKVSSAEVLLSHGEMGVYSLSQGRITLLSSKGAGYKVNQDLGGITYFKYKNGMFAVASEEGNVQIFSERDEFKQLGAFSVRTPIISFELLENDGKTYMLAGGANQTLSLYEIPSGTPVWTFNGKGSAFMQPVFHGSRIWLDQDGSVVAIDANSGKVTKKYPILGSGASLYVYGNTLYCSTPQKLLYAFPL